MSWQVRPRRGGGRRVGARPRVVYEADGIRFGSGIELQRYWVLKSRQERGEIHGLTYGKKLKIVLAPKYVDEFGRKQPERSYTPDFGYIETETGIEVREEVKPWNAKAPSNRRRDWELRMARAQELLPGIRFDLVKL